MQKAGSLIYKLVLIIYLVTISTLASAQHKLLGMYWNAAHIPLVASVNPSMKTLTNHDTLKGIHGIVSGIHAYDPVHGKYYGAVDMGNVTYNIYAIDAANGHIADTINVPIPGSMNCIEYDINADRLVGFRWIGGRLMYSAMNTATGTVTDIDTINGATGIHSGEVVFDPYNNLVYAVIDPTGIIAVDATTGQVLDTIPARFMNIQYNPINHTLMGVHFVAGTVFFSRMDIATRTLTDLDSLANVHGLFGESSFDPNTGKYYVATAKGIFVIDAASGATLDTINVNPAFMEIELTYDLSMLSLAGQPQSQTVSIGATAQFNVSTSETSPVFQWQESSSTGFRNMNNGGQYSGVNTSTLTVSNANVSNNNHKFRCIISTARGTNPSRIANLNVLLPSAVESQTGPFAYEVFSNPATGQVLVKGGPDLVGKGYAIYDAIGRVVLKGQFATAVGTIDCSMLPASVYVLDIASSKRFVISR